MEKDGPNRGTPEAREEVDERRDRGRVGQKGGGIVAQDGAWPTGRVTTAIGIHSVQVGGGGGRATHGGAVCQGTPGAGR